MVSTMVSNMVSTVQLALVNSPMLQGLMYGPAISSFTAGLCQTVRHVSAIPLKLLLPRCSYLAATAAILYSIIHLRCSTRSTAAEVRPIIDTSKNILIYCSALAQTCASKRLRRQVSLSNAERSPFLSPLAVKAP